MPRGRDGRDHTVLSAEQECPGHFWLECSGCRWWNTTFHGAAEAARMAEEHLFAVGAIQVGQRRFFF